MAGICVGLLIIIWSYINSKSPGYQSVMDIANKGFIEASIATRTSAVIFRSILMTMADSGEILAFINSWLVSTSVLCLEVCILANSLVQATLVAYPHLIESGTFETALNLGLRFGVPAVSACVSMIFYANEKPDSYFLMRGSQESHNWSLITSLRMSIGIFSIVAIVTTKLTIFLWNRNTCCFARCNEKLVHPQSGQSYVIFNEKALAIVGVHIIITTLLLVHGTEEYIWMSVHLVFSVAFPSYIVFTNERVHRHALRMCHAYSLVKRNRIHILNIQDQKSSHVQQPVPEAFEQTQAQVVSNQSFEPGLQMEQLSTSATAIASNRGLVPVEV